MSLFTCLNATPHYSKEFIKTQFREGKHRGPDYSKFGVSGIQVYMGSHHRIIGNILESDTIPYSDKRDITVLFSGVLFNLRELVDMAFLLDDARDISVEDTLTVLYHKYGFEHLLILLKGNFSIVLMDQSVSVENCVLYVARDAIGIEPLYYTGNLSPRDEYTTHTDPGRIILFATEKCMLNGFDMEILPFAPGTYSVLKLTHGVNPVWVPEKIHQAYYTLPIAPSGIDSNNSCHIHNVLLDRILGSVKSEICNPDHEWSEKGNHPQIACLISGGLKSAAIASVLAKESERMGLGTIQTFFIGFTDDHALLPRGYKNAEYLATFIGSNHTSILLSSFDFMEAFENVREWVNEEDRKNAAVFYAGAKWLKHRTAINTVFLGTGMDELVGESYSDRVYYDKKMRDRIRQFPEKSGSILNGCFGNHGIQIRVPFLNRDLIDTYFRFPEEYRVGGRENIETCFSLSISNPFLDKYLNWDILKCSPKTPYHSATPKCHR
jgi:asparagine synthetase B (glutamine-hydrolysing)